MVQSVSYIHSLFYPFQPEICQSKSIKEPYEIKRMKTTTKYEGNSRNDDGDDHNDDDDDDNGKDDDNNGRQHS